jgi:hypothetical protein
VPTHLKEYLDFLVEEVLDEKLRGGFDLNYFKKLPTPKEQVAYADKTLVKLDCGSERCAYVLSSGKILKLPTYPEHDKLFEQNREEIKTFLKVGSEYVPRIFDYDPDFWWLIVEPARTFSSYWDFKDKTGVSMGVVFTLDRILKSSPDIKDVPEAWNALVKKEEEEKREKEKEEEGSARWMSSSSVPWEKLPALGQQFLVKYHYLSNVVGLIDITRAEHWGWTSDGRLVCVDPGISTR